MLRTLPCRTTQSDAYPPESQSSSRGPYKELTNPGNRPTNTTKVRQT